MHPWPLHIRLMLSLIIPIAVFIVGYQAVSLLQQQALFADNENLRHELALGKLSAHIEHQGLTPEVIAPILSDPAVNGLVLINASGQVTHTLGQQVVDTKQLATFPQLSLTDGRRIVLLPNPDSQRVRLIVQMAQALFL